MTYIFWQNILSLHQSAFIRNLAEDNNVVLISEKGLDEERTKDGWNIPDFGNATVVVSPTDEKINFYLNCNDSIHTFTGIKAFPMVDKAFRIAVKLNLRIGVQLEAYESIGFRGYLRKLKYFLLQKRYGNNIDFLLIMSKAGCVSYQKVGFKKSKIFNWAYFTEESNTTIAIKNIEELPRLLFVGRLDQNKNLLGILPFIKNHLEKIESFTIIGDGNMYNEIVRWTNDKIIYKGVIANKDIFDEIAKADILVLPSLYDGWGAVVNEALTMGTKVLCSKNCGSSDLVSGKRGKVFSYESKNFELQLLNIIEEGCVSDNLRKEIAEWSRTHISGKSAVEYFVSIIKHIYNNEKIPSAPWI